MIVPASLTPQPGTVDSAALHALAEHLAAWDLADALAAPVGRRRYLIRRVPIAPAVGPVAFEVAPADDPGNPYHVHLDRHGEVRCTCGDFEFRRRRTGQPCKHGRLLLHLGGTLGSA